jgi:lipopolysaccharide transport system ATP-binding protein
MAEEIIKVENVSKLYRLGEVGTGTLADDLKRWWHLVRGKEDPFLEVGKENVRSATEGNLDFVWALKDINFNVGQGEVLGIIGNNGAGKSTLLKVLSKITAPTTGSITIKGRVASLLEVGTGFHPELTGRENIFLNGTILGMNKSEVKSKLDEIVDFSGVSKYLDTPVKRYSSGMMVRLGFAVAAHLEPEILIVDEVLAVGDAEFQKKCVGKMKDVSGQGRTVLFVSHNMNAVKSLCDRGILLKNGQIALSGDTDEIVSNYLKTELKNGMRYLSDNKEQDHNDFHLAEAKINLLDQEALSISENFQMDFDFQFSKSEDYYFSLLFLTYDNQVIFNYATAPQNVSRGKRKVSFDIPKDLLNNIEYNIRFAVCSKGKVLKVYDNILNFEIKEVEDRKIGWYGKWLGLVRPELEYTIS